MYLYYYLEDTHLHGMPKYSKFKKGTIAFVSEYEHLAVNLGCAYVELSEEQMTNLCFLRYDEDQHYVYEDVEEKETFAKELLRGKRKSLLTAFDTYRTNVQYGDVKETYEQKENLLNWYQRILDLDEEAIDNPPEEITYYL